MGFIFGGRKKKSPAGQELLQEDARTAAYAPPASADSVYLDTECTWYPEASGKAVPGDSDKGDAEVFKTVSLAMEDIELWCCKNGTDVPQDWWNKAIECFQKAADSGVPQAMSRLGWCYENGNGVLQDWNKAVEWYQRAADKRNAGAMVNLAECYSFGNGVQQDLNKALGLYQRVEASEDPVALAYLGMAYGNGYGVQKDLNRAFELYLRAAAIDGNFVGMECLAYCFDMGFGVRQSSHEAADWYRKAESAAGTDLHKEELSLLLAPHSGDAKAMYNLALAYEHGKGRIVGKQLKDAFQWYQKAACERHCEAMYSLAHCYERGTGVLKNMDKATEWYQKAVDREHFQSLFRHATESGHPQAICNLGVCYAEGHGVDIDTGKAFECFEKAANMQNPSAMDKLGLCYKHAISVSMDMTKAVEWFEKAAELGYSKAMINLGECHEIGNGKQKDAATAARWYQKAADYGDDDGMKRFLRLQETPKQGPPMIITAERSSTEAKEISPQVIPKAKRLSRGNFDQSMEAASEVEFDLTDLGDDPNAMCNLGENFYYGKGIVRQDMNKAVVWFQQAADLGHATAMFNLGRCHEYGFGVTQDVNKAVRWYQKAAELGDKDGIKSFKRLQDELQTASSYSAPEEKAETVTSSTAQVAPTSLSENHRSSQEKRMSVEPDVAYSPSAPKEDVMSTMPEGVRVSRERLQHALQNVTAPVELDRSYVEALTTSYLNKGAFGVVHKATDESKKWTFALKQVLYHLQGEEEAEFIRKAFEGEVAFLSQAQHPNIIRLFGYHLSTTGSNDHFLLFEYAEMGSLASVLSDANTRRALTASRRLHILLQTARVVSYLHANDNGRGVLLHRDIKSENICLTRDFQAKLIDCGLGKIVKENDQGRSATSFIGLQSGSSAFGTDGYRCPWYSQGKKAYKPACDIYSLGIVMMEVITSCLQGGRSSRTDVEIVNDLRTKYLEDQDQEEIENGSDILVQDADPGAGWEEDTLGGLAALAIQSCHAKISKRLTANQVLDELSRLIHVNELGSAQGNAVQSSLGIWNMPKCHICARAPRSIRCECGHGLCGSCLDTHIEEKMSFQDICCPLVGCCSRPYSRQELQQAASLQVFCAYDNRQAFFAVFHQYSAAFHQTLHDALRPIKQDLSFIRSGMTRMLKAVASQAAGIKNPCPKFMYVVPADKQVGSTPGGLQGWLKSAVKRKLHFYLICEHTWTPLAEPIVIEETRSWLISIAPVLKFSLVCLTAALGSAALGFLPPIAQDLVKTLFEWDIVLRATANILHSIGTPQSPLLLDQSSMGRQVIEVVGPSYQMISEKLLKAKRNGWTKDIQPVLDGEGNTIFVKKEFVKEYTHH